MNEFLKYWLSKWHSRFGISVMRQRCAEENSQSIVNVMLQHKDAEELAERIVELLRTRTPQAEEEK